MSADLGYYHIEFLKRDGSPDVDTAQAAFKWCQDEYDWFDKVNITLKDHYIIGDCLHVKDTDIPHEKNSIEDWIRDIGAEVDAELILASVLIDVSESDDNDKYHLVYKNGELETENYKYNKHLCGIVLASGEYLVCDLGYYDKYIYRGLFRNKKTGVEMNLGYLLIDNSGFYRFWRDDYIDGAPAAYVCNDEGETVEAPDEDIYNYSCFGIEDDEGSVSNVTPCEVLSSWQIKTDSDEILDVSEWEFVGFNACGMDDLVHRTRTKACSPTVVVIPEGTTTIEDKAFSGCKGLTSVTIPDSVTSIGARAFWGCEGLTSVTIPDSVTRIEAAAFEWCKGLTSVTIPDSVTSIGNEAFMGCEGLTSVTIPDGVTSIGAWAFWGCEGLTSVTIPDSVTRIEKGAFRWCEGLTSVTIPDSVTEIGEGAFRGCNITSLDHPCLKIENGLAVKDGVVLYYNSQSASVIIPDGVTSIGERAFRGCEGLTSVTIPDRVTSIGDWAFMGCTGLTSVTILDGVTSIGESAFMGCFGLTSVTIPDSVTSIGDYAFSCCYRLTSVTIPDSVTSIGEDAFEDCPLDEATRARIKEITG